MNPARQHLVKGDAARGLWDGLTCSRLTLGLDKSLTTRKLPPAIVLGGSQNALSVVRMLARDGIEVLVINSPYEAARVSRYARYVRLDGEASPAGWERFLLSEASEYLRGAVLFPCSDDAVSMVIRHHSDLARKFLLEETDPATRRELLDKFATYRRAQEAGIPTVGYWLASSWNELERSMDEYRFPLIMKPIYAPHAALLESKARFIGDRGALLEAFNVARGFGVDVVLMEYVPGISECSYHTYLDEHSQPLYQFTNHVIRRYPLMSGEATYCVADRIPDAIESGLLFLRHLRYRGLGMVQFKRDQRDGCLKIIESNPRFVASNGLMVRSGINIPLIAYNRITGRPQKPVPDYEQSVVFCRPLTDALAAYELHRRGELPFFRWLGEIRRVAQTPFFDWRDPLPALYMLVRRAWRGACRVLREEMAQRMRHLPGRPDEHSMKRPQRPIADRPMRSTPPDSPSQPDEMPVERSDIRGG